MGYVDITSRGHSYGEENWLISIHIGAAAIQSAVIYDNHLKIVYMTTIETTYYRGEPAETRYVHPVEVVMDLSPDYEDVLDAVKIRAFTDLPSGYSLLPANGWSFITPIFARGTPDLTPVSLTGSRSDDVLYGGAGADTLNGGRGNDVLHGERITDNHWIGGADVLKGGAGDDTIKGGNGHDVLHGERQADNHWLGGDDKLLGGAGHDELYGYRGDDLLNGGSGNDTVFGGKGADKLIGGKGNDNLDGGSGNDKLDGGAGADLIDGGAGNDVMTGGKGADIFVFHRPDPGTKHSDTVTDFALGVDKIRIGDDLLSGMRISPNLDLAEQTLTSITIHYRTEPDWTSLLNGISSNGITPADVQQIGSQVSPTDFRSSQMTLNFDDVSAQDFAEALNDAGNLNALLFDVV